MDGGDFLILIVVIFCLFRIFGVSTSERECKDIKRQAVDLGYAHFEANGEHIKFIWNEPEDKEYAN